MRQYPHDFPGVKPGSPDTAYAAAESVSEAASTRSRLALAFVGNQKAIGATADEGAGAYEWERYSSRPRLAELHARGSIVDSGNRRQGVSGRSQVVWVLPEFGPLPPAVSQGDLGLEAA